MASGQEHREGISAQEVRIRLDLAEAYLRNGEPRMSLQELLRIQRAASGAPRFQFTLGYTQFMLGNWPAAVEALERTVTLDPGHSEGWNNLGLAHLAQDDFTAAEFAFRRALDIPTYQTPEIAALNLALLNLERDDPVAAKRYAGRAMELNWRFGRAYLLAADIAAGQGNLDAAIKVLRKGVEADTANARMMLTLAEYLLLAGRDQEAQKWLGLVIETAPKGQEAIIAAGYLRTLKNDGMINGGDVIDRGFREQIGNGSAPAERVPMPPAVISSPPPERALESPLDTSPEAFAEPAFIVQIGGFLDQYRAVALRDAYLAKGYPAGITEVFHGGYQWFLVYIDRFPQLDAARTRADAFFTLENVNAVVTRVGMGRYLPMDSP